MGVTTLPQMGFQPGDVKPSASVLTQPGWLSCDGVSYLRTDYPALFAALGGAASPWGLPDGTHFNVPNLKGKTIVMVDAAQTEFATMAATGGSKTSTAPHTHSLSAHTHTLSTGSPSNNTSDGPSNNNSSAPSDNMSDWPNNNTSDGPNTTTQWQSDNFSNYAHFHGARFVRVVYDTANRTHAHAGGANTGSEGVSGGVFYGANQTIDVDTTDTNHWHGLNGHTHTMANHAHAMKNHYHNLSSHTHTMAAHTHSGTSAAPNSDITGASSTGAASGNLQPFTAMNYFIKT